MHRTLRVLAAASLVLVAGRATAQEVEFGDAHHVAISAERLFGFVHSSETRSSGGASATRDQDSFSLLANPLNGLSTGYGWPRIGVDVFVAPNVSVGGSAGFFNISPSSGSVSGFLFAPRAGYAAHLGSKVMIWPRGGITYENLSSDNGAGGSNTGSLWALTLEAPLVISVVPHAAILVGPTLDLGLAGSTSSGGVSNDDKATDFGIQAGLLVLL